MFHADCLQAINSLWPGDTILRHGTGLTLAQMGNSRLFLTAPSHYLNHCWFIISEVLWYSPESNSTVNVKAIILHNEFKNYTFQITATSPKGDNEFTKTHCGSVVSSAIIHPGNHCFEQWLVTLWCQTITWTNVYIWLIRQAFFLQFCPKTNESTLWPGLSKHYSRTPL